MAEQLRTLPRKVTFVRHGHYDGNISGDAGLSPEQIRERDRTLGLDGIGIQQARHVGQTIFHERSRPDYLIASPTRRTLETARLSVGEAWPDLVDKIIVDPRLREQNKGIDPGDYYEDDNLPNRSYQDGETLLQAGDRLESVLRDPEYADREIVVFTHARVMLDMRRRLGRHNYVSLRDEGLQNGMHGIYIQNAQAETYERTEDPATGILSPWFTQMEVEETWGDNPKRSGVIFIANN